MVLAPNTFLVLLCLFDLGSKELNVLVGPRGPLAGASRQTAPMTEESYQAIALFHGFKTMKTFVRSMSAEHCT